LAEDENSFEGSAGESGANLRKGWTTGACAAAAAVSAYGALLTGRFNDPVGIRLPRGQTPSFALHDSKLDGETAMAAIEKDAGDDPDVTHGAIVRATVRRLHQPGEITFKAGPGVGTVTKPGLPLGVGEPAINPGPRAMIADNLRALGGDGLEITIAIDDGEALAARTWNPRLGILGGLSVLGTTGIVVPYSCSAWIASIRQAVDVARAGGISHLAAATGSVSEDSAAKLLGLPETAMIDMGDFAGGLLKYVRDHPVPKLTIAGGFGKLSKLADGHLDLHSKRSSVNPGFLAGLAREAGAEDNLCRAIEAADSAGRILEIVREADFALADAVAARAQLVALEQLQGAGDMEILIFDRAGALAGRSP
jgi:cobalt-precorrin-5B (C1)-methyltransferase